MQSRTYTVEFKQQAVELAKTLGSVKKAADQLGISDVNIHVWKKKLAPKASVSEESPNEGLKRLRLENAQQKKVIHILKSSAAFFSQDHLS